MKILLLAISLALATVAMGQTAGLSPLEKRCAELERQVRELEENNRRLAALLEQYLGGESTRPAGGGPAAPKPAADAASPATRTYVVKPGDSLGVIASRHGSTTRELARLNQLNDKDMIRAGQVIKVPCEEPAGSEAAPGAESPDAASGGADELANRIHVVREGETYSEIAKKHGLSVVELVTANPGVDPGLMRVGQELNLMPIEPLEKLAESAKSEPGQAPKAEPAPGSGAKQPPSRTGDFLEGL